MFGYVEKFTNKALTFMSNSYFISINTPIDELKFALAYYTKKHPVIGEIEDVEKFIKWYLKEENFNIVHVNYEEELRRNGKN